MTSKAQQIELDNALVSLENRRVIGKCNMRINPGMKPKQTTYQVALDALDLTTCYPAFLITAEVLVIYLHQFWATVTKHKALYRFKIDNKKFSLIICINYREPLHQSSTNVSVERMFMHTARDDSLLGTIRFVSRHADTQVYGAVLPEAMKNKALLDSVAYKNYYAIASGTKPLKLKKS
ncbi:hypothetical protein Tco_1461370 [Tanacetum coccineum]